jgi:hypothetical protein
MKPVLCFLRQMNGFLNDAFGSMRHRIPAATLPYTYRNHSRKHCRISSLNRKGRELSFAVEMIYAMSRKNLLSLGFLMTFSNRGIA